MLEQVRMLMRFVSGKTHGLVRVEYRIRKSLHAEAFVAGQRVWRISIWNSLRASNSLIDGWLEEQRDGQMHG